MLDGHATGAAAAQGSAAKTRVAVATLLYPTKRVPIVALGTIELKSKGVLTERLV